MSAWNFTSSSRYPISRTALAGDRFEVGEARPVRQADLAGEDHPVGGAEGLAGAPHLAAGGLGGGGEEGVEDAVGDLVGHLVRVPHAHRLAGEGEVCHLRGLCVPPPRGPCAGNRRGGESGEAPRRERPTAGGAARGSVRPAFSRARRPRGYEGPAGPSAGAECTAARGRGQSGRRPRGRSGRRSRGFLQSRGFRRQQPADRVRRRRRRRPAAGPYHGLRPVPDFSAGGGVRQEPVGRRGQLGGVPAPRPRRRRRAAGRPRPRSSACSARTGPPPRTPPAPACSARPGRSDSRRRTPRWPAPHAAERSPSVSRSRTSSLRGGRREEGRWQWNRDSIFPPPSSIFTAIPTESSDAVPAPRHQPRHRPEPLRVARGDEQAQVRVPLPQAFVDVEDRRLLRVAGAAGQQHRFAAPQAERRPEFRGLRVAGGRRRRRRTSRCRWWSPGWRACRARRTGRRTRPSAPRPKPAGGTSVPAAVAAASNRGSCPPTAAPFATATGTPAVSQARIRFGQSSNSTSTLASGRTRRRNARHAHEKSSGARCTGTFGSFSRATFNPESVETVTTKPSPRSPPSQCGDQPPATATPPPR